MASLDFLLASSFEELRNNFERSSLRCTCISDTTPTLRLGRAMELCMKFLLINLSTSSKIITGKESTKIAIHSRPDNALTLNITERGGMYIIATWRSIEREIAPSSHGLLHGGKVNSEQFSDNALRALNISTTTRTDIETVEGSLVSNTEQSGFWPSPQCWNDLN